MPLDSSTAALSIVCYNVHRCFSTDGHYRPDLIAAVLNEMNPDVAVLTHIDPVLWTEDQIPQAEFFSQRLQSYVASGPIIANKRGNIRTILLSRFRISNVRSIYNQTSTEFDCVTLDADLDINNTIVRLVVLRAGDNLERTVAQLDAMLTSIERNQADQHIVIAGDFADIKRPLALIQKLDRHFDRSAVSATYPSLIPMFAQQRLWTRAPLSLVNCRAHSSPISRYASSYLPLCGELQGLSSTGFASKIVESLATAGQSH